MERVEEERLLLPAESVAEAVVAEQKKVRQRKPKPAAEGGNDQAKKRRLSDEQARLLETSFLEDRKLETPRKEQLAAAVGLDAKQVAVWFQNRRARHKTKVMEEELAKLRAAHDADVLKTCHLETELLKLKDRLAEAEAEKNQLIAAAAAPTTGGAGSSNPTAALVGQFGVEEEAADLSSYMMDFAADDYCFGFDFD